MDSDLKSSVFLLYFVDAVFSFGGQQVMLSSNVFLSSIHYMPTAVCGQVKMQPRLVPPTVVFLIPLASSLRLGGETLFFIYNGKMMFEIFTTTRGGKSFNKTWTKTMAEVALRTRTRMKWVCRTRKESQIV